MSRADRRDADRLRNVRIAAEMAACSEGGELFVPDGGLRRFAVISPSSIACPSLKELQKSVDSFGFVHAYSNRDTVTLRLRASFVKAQL
jgi:hypothetical protein